MTFCATMPAQSADLPPNLDTTIADGMKAWQLPGMAIAVVKDGQPILVKGYGVLEVGKPDKVDSHGANADVVDQPRRRGAQFAVSAALLLSWVGD